MGERFSVISHTQYVFHNGLRRVYRTKEIYRGELGAME